MKNLVIFHMESLSNSIFRMNPEFFPNINKWASQMETYTNYYSSATSTLMVIADLFYGDMNLFEESKYLEDVFYMKPQKSSLFDELYKRGYSTYSLYYGLSKGENEDRRKMQKIIAAEGKSWYGDNQDELEIEFGKIIDEDEPFAIFIEDGASHISYKGKRVAKEKDYGNRLYQERYKAIDKTVGLIFDLLVVNKEIDNTVVLLYGDHGEEYWFHGLYEGYTHAIEPFTSVMNCPLFVFDSSHSKGANTRLIGTEDLANLIKTKLGIEKEINEKKYVFSRNLFANQIKRTFIFNKAYAVTDGEYTLIMTKKGLAMFLNKIDPYNQKNILDFFDYKNGRIVYRKEFDLMISSHYKNFMNQGQKQEIIDEFQILRQALKEKVNSLPGRYKIQKIDKIQPGTRKIIFHKELIKNRLLIRLTDKK